MYGLESSSLSIEAAWEHSQHHSHPHQHGQLELNQHHSQHSQHTLNLNHPAHQRLQETNHYQFGYSAAFPQYTIPPISPVSPSTSSISSSSSASSAEPTTPLGADYLVRRAFGNFNTHSNDANTCLPTHQLFDFDFAHLTHGGPPSPSLTSSSTTDSHGAPLMTPTSPMVSVSVPSNSFSTDAYDIDAELDEEGSPEPAPRPTASKRTAGAPPTTTKKARASNSISTKDFVPPDVTGLSKREARLVKNRAAAFLSRQRKREEFELMEIRVAELEQENARLKSLVDNPSSSTSHTSSSSSESRTSPTPSSPSPEIEQLRAQLAAARTRENELAERLERVKYQAQREQAREREELVRLRALVGSGSSALTSASTSTSSDGLRESVELGKENGRVAVKEEERERESESDTTSSGASTPAQPVKNLLANPRSGASLGLMVLLCALPSLLSSSSTSSSSLPTASSFLDVHPSAFDASSAMLPTSDSTNALHWEFDWAGRPRARSSSRPSSSSSTAVSHSQSSKMDVDHVEESEQGWTKLEFDSEEAEALSDFGLGALDISFETRRADDGSGRVRVRVHSSPQQQHQHLRAQQSQNHLSLPSPSGGNEGSDEETEDLGPFLTSTPSSASRSSSQSHSMLDGLNLGFGLNTLNNFGMNDLSMGMGMGVDTMSSLGMGMGMPFGTPDYGLDSNAHGVKETATRRRVRIALARLPHAGGEGGEWDVVEVAA